MQMPDLAVAKTRHTDVVKIRLKDHSSQYFENISAYIMRY